MNFVISDDEFSDISDMSDIFDDEEDEIDNEEDEEDEIEIFDNEEDEEDLQFPEPMDIDIPTIEELETYSQVSETLKSLPTKIEFHNCVFVFQEPDTIFGELYNPNFLQDYSGKLVPKTENKIEKSYDIDMLNYEVERSSQRKFVKERSYESKSQFIDYDKVYKLPIIRNRFKYVGRMGVYKGRIHHWVEREDKRSSYRRNPVNY